MTLADRLVALLRKRSPEPICDECLADQLRAEKEEVRALSSSIGLGGFYTRELGTCPVCAREAMLGRWR
jgi:hypothetical protein